MMKWFSSLRFRLIISVLLAALPALGLTLFSGLEQRDVAAQNAQENALHMADFAAVNQSLLIENTRGFLVALSHAMASQGGSIIACENVFSHLLQNHFPFYAAFYVADLNGNILCTMVDGDLPEDLEHCEHYNELIMAEDFVVSQYHICRNSGKPVVSMGYPVWNYNEEKIGVINVSINLERLNQLAASANLPPGTTQTILDDKGAILARYPDTEFFLGTTIPEDSIMFQIPEHVEGTLEGQGIDGIQRLYGFTPLEGTEKKVFMSVGVPAEVAYEEASQNLTRNLILLGIATIAALGAAWLLSELFVIRQTQRLVDATEKLAEGDLATRSNISYDVGEFGQLAQAFDQMAESLMQREEERDRAIEATREYAENLELSNRDLEDFAYIASHDMQEPLRKIQTFSSLLQSRYGDSFDEKGADYLARMHSAATRLQRLTTDLLTYSRISTKAEPSKVVDLNETARNVIEDLDLLIDETNATFHVEGLPRIKADPTQMQLLLQNLIGNALKFRQKDIEPSVIIKGENIGRNNCLITIADNGIGFDEKYQDRIFQPFQKLHGRQDYPGTGMGLAICRKIIVRHGGQITVNSKPGEGTEFSILLPCSQDGEGET